MVEVGDWAAPWQLTRPSLPSQPDTVPTIPPVPISPVPTNPTDRPSQPPQQSQPPHPSEGPRYRVTTSELAQHRPSVSRHGPIMESTQGLRTKETSQNKHLHEGPYSHSSQGVNKGKKAMTQDACENFPKLPNTGPTFRTSTRWRWLLQPPASKPRSYFNMTPNAWKMLLCSPNVPRPISEVARYRPNIIGHPGINPNLSTKRSPQNHAHQSRETTSARPQLPQKSRYAMCCTLPRKLRSVGPTSLA